jgi:hypothetical protein
MMRGVAASVLRWLGRRPAGSSAPSSRPRTAPPPVHATTRSGSYPGDYTGALRPVYAPSPDGRPDPGEIVWTWVPYEEDHSRGKDRPVLLVGHDGPWLLGLQLTSKDHDAGPGRRSDPRWVDIGTGAWDRQSRPSEVRVDRVVRIEEDAVRREGAVLSPDRFEDVSRAVEAQGRR